MSQFENLFKVTDAGIELNKQELRGHDTFKKFIGTKKENLQDMMFIYLMGDPRSMYSHLMGQEKIDAVKKHIGRPLEWQPQAQLKSAVGTYEEMVALTPTGKSFLAANKNLYATGEDINDIVEANAYLKSLLKSKIAVLESDQLGSEEVKILANECKAIITGILKNQADASNIIKSLPDTIKTVEKLATAWANEGNGTKEIYGGGQLNNRE